MMGAPPRGTPPRGLVGMIALVVAVEAFVSRRAIDLVGPEAWEWRQSGRAASRRATDNEILCFGSSMNCFGVLPRLIHERLGTRAFNVSLCGGPTPASYFLLRRALATGARPAAVLVDFHPEALSSAPWSHMVFARLWPELLTARECLELSWSARDAGFFADSLLAMRLPSYRARFATRSGVAAALRGESSSKRPLILAMQRNKRLNLGSLLQPLNPHFRGEIQDQYRGALLPDSWAPHLVSVRYARKFVELAASRGIPVFWVIPPFAPALQGQREAKGLDACYRRFARAMLDQYPNLTVVSALRSGYAVPAFADAGHLNRRGAVAFSAEVADVLRGRLDGRGGPRWVDLPPYRQRPDSIPMEDFAESMAAIQGGLRR